MLRNAQIEAAAEMLRTAAKRLDNAEREMRDALTLDRNLDSAFTNLDTAQRDYKDALKALKEAGR